MRILRFFKVEHLEKQAIYFLVFAIFIGANMLFSPFSARLDFSKGKAYTLSPATNTLLKNLDDIVTVKFFISSDIPTKFLPLKTDVVDLLNEYKKAGGKKIQVKILDPKKDPTASNEVRELGIPELQFSQLESDKYQVSTAYIGLALLYGAKKEIIPQLTDLEGLEYNLTASIYKLTRKELAKIAIIGQEENFNPQEDNLAVLKSILEKQFVFEFADLSEDLSSYKTILFFDDRVKEYTEEEIGNIKKYLNSKGKILFFVDGVWVSDSLSAAPAKHNLFTLLSDWGITLNSNLVLSASAELVNFGNEQLSLLLPYPFWVKAGSFQSASSYFLNMNQVTYPWTSSLDIAKKDGFEITDLVKTSTRSWEQKDAFTLNPETIIPPQQKDMKEFVVAAESKHNGANIVVIPSSRFIADQYLSRGSGNLDFILNALNSFASDNALLGIRRRTVSLYPVPDIGENQKDIFKYTNMLLFPGIFAVYGMLRLTRKRKNSI